MYRNDKIYRSGPILPILFSTEQTRTQMIKEQISGLFGHICLVQILQPKVVICHSWGHRIILLTEILQLKVVK